MADLTSAGTMVGAMLQTSGLAAQERILNDFAPFFDSMGALLYIVAGIGAVFSAAIFGNFRMARYLLLGPVLFWFLVEVRDEREGVYWQLGGGSPRTMEGKSDKKKSAAQMREINTASEHSGSEEVPESYQISWAFNWFTSNIDKFVSNMVDLILHYEDGEDLDFISRTRAMGMIAGSNVEHPLLSRMLLGSFGIGCDELLGASYALSSPHLDIGRVESFIDKLAAESLKAGNLEEIRQQIQTQRESYQLLLASAKENEIFNLDQPTISYMIDNPNSEYVKEYLGKIGKASPELLSTADSMHCIDMWHLLTEAIMKEADLIYKRVLEGQAVYDKDEKEHQKAQDRLCRAVAGKLASSTMPDLDLVANTSGENAVPCDLVGVTTMFMMKNALTSAGGFNQRINKLKSDIQMIASSKRKDKIAAISLNRNDLEIAGSADRPISNYDALNGQLVIRFCRKDTERIGNNDCHERDVEWHPIARVSKVGGHADTAFGEHQTFLARGLRQKIFHWSLQLPYYQGMLLYFISIVYPFMALIVVLPSHASAFLYIPLAWLWVKSWDIGFALVIVMEKVLWNLFPQTDLDVGFARGESFGGPPLPNVLGETMKIDPTYHLHAYYFMIGTVMFAIPQITGYAILKAKASALASFTQGPQSSAQRAQDRAESAYGIARIAEKQQSLNARRAIAQRANDSGYQFAALLNNKNLDASVMENYGAVLPAVGAMAGKEFASSAVPGIINGSLSNGIKGGTTARALLSSFGKTGTSTMKKWNSLAQAESQVRGEYDAMFDDEFGTQGILSRMIRGTISSEEASTFSFEAGDNQHAHELMASYISSSTTNYRKQIEVTRDVIKNIANNGLKGGGKGPIGAAAAATMMAAYGLNHKEFRNLDETKYPYDEEDDYNAERYEHFKRSDSSLIEVERSMDHREKMVKESTKYIKRGMTDSAASAYCLAVLRDRDDAQIALNFCPVAPAKAKRGKRKVPSTSSQNQPGPVNPNTQKGGQP